MTVIWNAWAIAWPALIEWGAVLFNIAYVWLAIQGKRTAWLAGIVGVILSFWVYVQALLYSDALLQVFYLVLSVYGWWSWRPVASRPPAVVRMPPREHLWVVVPGLVAGGVLGWFWSSRGAAYPYWDGWTTSFSMLATYLVARRRLENWLYWIVIDLTCVVIYLNKGLQPFALLFLVYTVMALLGYVRWRRERMA